MANQDDFGPTTTQGRTAPESEVPERTVIPINDMDFEEQTERAVSAFIPNPNLEVYARATRLVHVRSDWTGRRTLVFLSPEGLRAALLQVAEFRVAGSRPSVAAPPDLARHIAAGEFHRFPLLLDFVQSPPVTPDLRIITRPGYDKEALTYYAPLPGFTIPPITPPTDAEISQARRLILDELLVDFPFVDEASRAGAVALLLTSIARGAISGQVPMFVITKPQERTGATLLAKVAGILATGSEPPAVAPPQQEDEWRKTIPALLSGAPSNILLDNLKGTLSSSALASAITASSVGARVLGRNDEAVDTPQRAAWILTGNNVSLGAELTRRACLIALDAKSATPWTNRAYRHPRLPEWVAGHRAELVTALLRLIAAARTRQATASPPAEMGGFERWEQFIGQVLEVAGIPGFLANNQPGAPSVDVEGSAWARLLEFAVERFGEAVPFSTASLRTALGALGSLEAFPDEVIRALAPTADASQLGRALRAQMGARRGNRAAYLVQADKDSHLNVVQWEVRSPNSDSAG